MCFVLVLLKYPGGDGISPYIPYADLISDDAEIREHAISTLFRMKRYRNKWNPHYGRFLIETFIRYYKLNKIAGTRGLTANSSRADD